jgi:hypothetical protein
MKTWCLSVLRRLWYSDCNRLRPGRPYPIEAGQFPSRVPVPRGRAASISRPASATASPSLVENFRQTSELLPPNNVGAKLK